MWEKVATSYFSKQADFHKIDLTMPKEDLGIVVVIPCYNEPNLTLTLESLSSCCDPGCGVLVLVVVNYPADSSSEIRSRCAENLAEVASAQQNFGSNWLAFQGIELADVQQRDAGVGYARKIGMDQAAYLFLEGGKLSGIIDCFDADALCDHNYLKEIALYSKKYPDLQAASIYYEHPINGDTYAPALYEGIANYELHLRYYVWALRMIQYPYAYHTVGSSMLCRASAYVRFGGMNRRKAGEDFYFLQKIIPHGGYYEITNTRVIPSPRVSERVPFGTGRAMLKMSEANSTQFETYSLDSFEILGILFGLVEQLYQEKEIAQLEKLLHPALQEYLRSIGWVDAVEEVRANSSKLENFVKRFYLWFNAFRVLKFLNFAHEGWFEKKPIAEEAAKLLTQMGQPQVGDDAIKVLEEYRKLDRKAWDNSIATQ
ncbi:MAG TPA: hypothetical protein VMV56_08785 [Williamwhitmania sp.]|nr:hypothetical protein [Williamwhitmania sp.]